MLFQRKRLPTKIEVPPPKPPKKPVPQKVKAEVMSINVYEDLANELGFAPAQLLEKNLLLFLAQNEIPIFNLSEVDAYLRHEANKTQKFWIWRALREKDKLEGWRWDGEDNLGNKIRRGHGSYINEWEYRPYDKLVPIYILRQVKKIEDQFNNQVSFFVSDYASPNPDPFIMVTALDVKRIIFGVWDEPDFGLENL